MEEKKKDGKCPECGADVINDDWAGPESGGMGAHCTNPECGWGFNTAMY